MARGVEALFDHMGAAPAASLGVGGPGGSLFGAPSLRAPAPPPHDALGGLGAGSLAGLAGDGASNWMAPFVAGQQPAAAPLGDKPFSALFG
jgi:hypothetical protein